MLYQFFEMQHAAMAPFRSAAKAGLEFWSLDTNPFAQSVFGRQANASLKMFERFTRRYSKPEFGISQIEINGKAEPVEEIVDWQKPFCRLLHFAKPAYQGPAQKKMLIVAPLSGHFATLLRNTVEGMLPEHDVFLTDWSDARHVAKSAGSFDLDDYTDYVIEILHHLGERANVMAVCQPAVPVLAAVSILSKNDDPLVPLNMVLMGGPIDTRSNPTAVNRLALEKGETWFRRNMLSEVPAPHLGAGRKVYPGFLQLAGFLSMNPDRHVSAHRNLYWHMVDGDVQSADKLQQFYDEYMSVMDLDGEFYMQTVERVFINQRLAHGTYKYRGELIEPGKITKTGLLTVEGERDDITGPGQTQAAHKICSGLAENLMGAHMQMGVGHYGVFSGRRFLAEVVPVINGFVAKHQG